jgi:hypothetical protein
LIYEGWKNIAAAGALALGAACSPGEPDCTPEGKKIESRRSTHGLGYDEPSKSRSGASGSKPQSDWGESGKMLKKLSPAESEALVRDVARKMGIRGAVDARTHGGVPKAINGQRVPDELLTAEELEVRNFAEKISKTFGQ